MIDFSELSVYIESLEVDELILHVSKWEEGKHLVTGLIKQTTLGVKGILIGKRRLGKG